MARDATAWAYGSGESNVLKLGLSANELSILRALCWKIHPSMKRTEPVSNGDLADMTDIRHGKTLENIRKRLKELNLILYTPANVATKDDLENKETSLAFVYVVNFPRARNYFYKLKNAQKDHVV